MYALQAVLLLFLISVADSDFGYPKTQELIRPKAENVINKYENKTIAELEKMQMERIARMQRTFESKEDKEKIDKMVLEEFEKQAKEFKEYSAISDNKKMTLKEYRKALEDFADKHEGRIPLFEARRAAMRKKLAKEERAKELGNSKMKIVKVED